MLLETMRFFANFFENPVKCEIMHRYYEMFLFQVRYSSSWACVQEVVAPNCPARQLLAAFTTAPPRHSQPVMALTARATPKVKPP